MSNGSDLVHGDRMETHGHPYPNMAKFAGYLSAKFGVFCTPRDAVQVMQLFKIAREGNNHNDENLDDLEGYVEVMRMVIDWEDQEAQQYTEEEEDDDDVEMLRARIELLETVMAEYRAIMVSQGLEVPPMPQAGDAALRQEKLDRALDHIAALRGELIGFGFSPVDMPPEIESMLLERVVRDGT